MKLDLTKPVQTRSGKPVRILCTNFKGRFGQTVLGVITHDADHEEVIAWTATGQYHNYLPGQALINVPPPKATATRHLYLYRKGDQVCVHQTAGNDKPNNILAQTTVTLTEGDGSV